MRGSLVRRSSVWSLAAGLGALGFALASQAQGQDAASGSRDDALSAFAGIIGATKASVKMCGQDTKRNRQALAGSEEVAGRRYRQLGLTKADLDAMIAKGYGSYRADHAADPAMPDCALLDRQIRNLDQWTDLQRAALGRSK